MIKRIVKSMNENNRLIAILQRQSLFYQFTKIIFSFSQVDQGLRVNNGLTALNRKQIR